MMQTGMMVGFVTSWPVNRWLLVKSVKEPMMTTGMNDAYVRHADRRLALRG
jgi:hypothetical protein